MKQPWVALIIISVIISLLVLNIPPATAAGVSFTFSVGYGGYVTPGKWNPLRVTVNQTVADGRIAVIRPGQGKAEEVIVETFPLQGFQLDFPVLADEHNRYIKIQLLSGEQVLAEQLIDLNQRVFPGHLILALEVPAVIQQKLSKVLLPEEPVRVAPVKSADLGTVFLHYDSVSALVMRDPGPVLAPAQVEAIYSWLTGGGKLILSGIHPGRRSLLAEFAKLKLPRNINQPLTVKVGRGEVWLWQEDFNLLNQQISSWQQVLKLKPYKQSARFSASDCFPVLPPPPSESKPPETRPRPLKTYLGIYLFLGIWALLAAIVTLAGQRHNISYLLGFSLIVMTIAYPVGSLVSQQWQRGTEVCNRALILPRGGGILWASDIKMADWDIFDAGACQSSPWGAVVTLGRDNFGTIRSRNARQTIWKHRTVSARSLIREKNPNVLNLVGIINPGPSLEPSQATNNAVPEWWKTRKNRFAKEIAYWDGKVWWQIQNQQKKPTPHGQIPNWLQKQRQWIEILIQLFQGQSWVFRRGVLPELELKIEGSPAAEVLFVVPLEKG